MTGTARGWMSNACYETSLVANGPTYTVPFGHKRPGAFAAGPLETTPGSDLLSHALDARSGHGAPPIAAARTRLRTTAHGRTKRKGPALSRRAFGKYSRQ
jgi:hypothetical protein